MSRSAPNTPKRGREDELTGIAFPEHTFKARAPRTRQKRLDTDKVHRPTRAHIHHDARH